MARRIVESVQVRGSLLLDPKSDTEGLFPRGTERVLAWDEDATTLAVAAARALAGPLPAAAVVGPRIDIVTFQVALGLDAPPLVADDPLRAARAQSGRVLAVGSDGPRAVALVVDDGDAADAEMSDASPKPVVVSATRALLESRRVPPEESVPDSPMGAYVPMGTWLEDLPARLRLLAQRCQACEQTLYPPRGACPGCRGTEFEPLALPEEAQVYTATLIGRGGAPSEFALEQMQVGAYWVAVVDWPVHGVRVTTRLAGFGEEKPVIGQPVRAVVRRLFEQEGATRYGVKFVPAWS